MKLTNRLFALLLAVVMVLSLIPTVAFAEDQCTTPEVCTAEAHTEGCALYVTPTPATCPGDDSCTATEGHIEGCPSYVPAPATCPGDDSCTVTEGHIEGCPSYVPAPATCPGNDSCTATEGHVEGCPSYVPTPATCPGDDSCTATEGHIEGCPNYIAPCTHSHGPWNWFVDEANEDNNTFLRVCLLCQEEERNASPEEVVRIMTATPEDVYATKAALEQAVVNNILTQEAAQMLMDTLGIMPTVDQASINGTGYASLEAAISAASDGDTITLLADADVTGITINKTLCLDLGQNTLTGNLDACVADGYSHFQKFGSSYVSKIFIDKVKQPPVATVTKLDASALNISTHSSWGSHLNQALTLDTGYLFTAPYDENGALESQYSPYHVDFVVYADKSIPANTIALAGQYDAFSPQWVTLSDSYTAGTEIRLLQALLNGGSMNYYELCKTVKNFKCGAIDLSKNGALNGVTLTVELRMYPVEYHVWGTTTWNNEKQGAEPITIGKYSYTWGETLVTYLSTTDGNNDGNLDNDSVTMSYQKTLTVNPNGGNWTKQPGFVEQNDGTYTLTMDGSDTLVVGAPVKANHAFAGWSMTKDTGGNVKLVANWKSIVTSTDTVYVYSETKLLQTGAELLPLGLIAFAGIFALAAGLWLLGKKSYGR